MVYNILKIRFLCGSAENQRFLNEPHSSEERHLLKLKVGQFYCCPECCAHVLFYLDIITDDYHVRPANKTRKTYKTGISNRTISTLKKFKYLYTYTDCLKSHL